MQNKDIATTATLKINRNLKRKFCNEMHLIDMTIDSTTNYQKIGDYQSSQLTTRAYHYYKHVAKI